VNPVRGVHRLAVLTAAATFLLLFVGGLVTSTGSGLAVPDWPLSFGRFFPVLQITLGGATIWSSRAVPATTSHLVVGAALLATSLTLTLRASRFVGWRRPARATAGPGRHPFP